MRALAVLLIAAVLIAGCPAPSEGTPGEGTPSEGEGTPSEGATVQTVDMIIFHSFYQPARITVPLGTTLRIRATTAPGTESHKHGITVSELGINQAVTTSDKNNPVVVDLRFTAAGEYLITCGTCDEGSFADHPDQRAFLTVTP